jgi:hypothetical protein
MVKTPSQDTGITGIPRKMPFAGKRRTQPENEAGRGSGCGRIRLTAPAYCR